MEEAEISDDMVVSSYVVENRKAAKNVFSEGQGRVMCKDGLEFLSLPNA